MHVADLMPTLLEVAGTSYPKTRDGKDVPPLAGKSWNRMLAGQAESPRTAEDYLAWEIFGNRAVRQGDWKIRWEWKPYGTGNWQLFNLVDDVGERKDLARERPDKLKALLALWDDYARANNVIVPNRSMFETLEDQLPVRVPDETGYPPLIYKRQFEPPKALLADPKP
jgi:arylsulfatase